MTIRSALFTGFAVLSAVLTAPSLAQARNLPSENGVAFESTQTLEDYLCPMINPVAGRNKTVMAFREICRGYGPEFQEMIEENQRIFILARNAQVEKFQMKVGELADKLNALDIGSPEREPVLKEMAALDKERIEWGRKTRDESKMSDLGVRRAYAAQILSKLFAFQSSLQYFLDIAEEASPDSFPISNTIQLDHFCNVITASESKGKGAIISKLPMDCSERREALGIMDAEITQRNGQTNDGVDRSRNMTDPLRVAGRDEIDQRFWAKYKGLHVTLRAGE